MSKCFNCMKEIKSNAIYGLHEDCFIKWFGRSTPEAFHDLDPKKHSAAPSDHEIHKKIDTFYHGKFLKYSARLGSTSYILKIQEDKYPDLPIVEYLCNQIAEILNIEVPAYYLINFNGRITFVTRNFMQDYIGTLDHIYKFLPEGTENHNCDEIIKLILTQTGKLSDIAKFIEICLFDSLIGNTDRHGRNLGIITTAQVKKLAPMYDNPTTLGIEPDYILEAHYNPSGSIWTKASKEPKPLDYLMEFERLGYQSIVTHFCTKLRTQSTRIIDLIKNSDIANKRKNAILKLFETRSKEFNYGK